jgi:hypothetical protein
VFGQSTVEDLGVPLGALGALAVSGALVGVRGEIHPEVTALALAVTVALAGRLAGRGAGISAALMAAASFDFMHTQPYLSLKIANTSDVLTTLLLLLVGIVVGDLASRAGSDRRRAHDLRSDPTGLTRVLHVARGTSPEDVEASVRAELLGLLQLRDCWFTRDEVHLPVIGPWGQLDLPRKRFAGDGFELPPDGVAIEVSAYGRRYGYLVCQPEPGVGVTIERRRVAAELGDVLGLALGASTAA